MVPILGGLRSLITACVVVTTTGDIIRDDDGGIEGEFSIVTSGRRYTNVLLFVEDVNLQGCLVSCLQHIQCNNINYNEGERFCEFCADNVDGLKGDANAVGWWSYGTPQKVDGGWGIWMHDGVCSQTCGIGIQRERRECNNPTPYGGNICEGESTKTTTCKHVPCPVDGGYGQWSSYESCSKTCGPGEQKRTRLCDTPTPIHGGKSCEQLGSSTDTKKCNTNNCPVDGGYGQWSSYDKCTQSCGGTGTQKRTRECNKPTPMHGGKDCTLLGDPTEAKSCYEKPCPSEDGGYGEWSSYTKCTKNCGGTGTQTRIRKCDTPTPSHGGKDCTSLGKDTETAKCNTNKCPVCPLKHAVAKGDGLDHLGDNSNVDSWQSCSILCDGEVTCIYWVWKTNQMCYLKKTYTHLVFNSPDATSGPKGCRAPIAFIPLVNATQSSDDRSGKHPATKALDGGISITSAHTGCSVTQKEKDPWWSADLAKSYYITTIQIMRRMGTCPQCQYPHVKVKTSDDGGIWNLCEGLGDKLNGATGWVDATCPDRTLGRHIKIKLYDDLNLSLCEVKAWGYAKRVCAFNVGDGVPDGKQTYIRGGTETTLGCVKMCEEKRKTDSTINAVTVSHSATDTNEGYCYCWKNLKTIDPSKTGHKTCFLEVETGSGKL